MDAVLFNELVRGVSRISPCRCIQAMSNASVTWGRFARRRRHQPTLPTATRFPRLPQGALPELDYCSSQKWQSCTRRGSRASEGRVLGGDAAAARTKRLVGTRRAPCQRPLTPPLPMFPQRSFCELDMAAAGAASWVGCDVLLQEDEEECRCVGGAWWR